MLNRLFNTTKTIVNTDGNGNFKPSDFNLIVYSSVVEMYEELFEDATKLSNRHNRGLIGVDLENTLEKNREKLEHYLEPSKSMVYQNGSFLIPSDLRYFDSVRYKSTSIEMLKSYREFNEIQDDVGIEYPVGIKQGLSIKVAPVSIKDNVEISYLRNPKLNKWTYILVDGVEMFNPDANDFQDVDIHPGEEHKLLFKILLRFGINLKEKDLQEIAQRHEAQDFNQKITN
ncbi:hypothetical protein [Wenyingzhuangia sp. 2_MG-2023]|uniref:hypothetical protein n=1 Tax=Wenyingzhuangia sp. 2_MG-2023 TaxID=3062639 RepID=UPI0026E2E4B2|nr:hypothetical protein [Wenyingzhuangia sp. 2_MG-2023]MDO6737109.1 hypothetical protein [Wenyingzhuangia sp. 2_MG-2023]